MTVGRCEKGLLSSAPVILAHEGHSEHMEVVPLGKGFVDYRLREKYRVGYHDHVAGALVDAGSGAHFKNGCGQQALVDDISAKILDLNPVANVKGP